MSRILKDGENQITQKYKKDTHKALDIVKYKNSLGTIIAHSDGEVVMYQTGKKNQKGSTGTLSYGNYVKLRHSNGYYTLYAHLSTVSVKKGDIVKKGDVLGKMGDSGNAYGAHLHFEVRTPDNKRIDPTPYLDKDLPDINPDVITYQVYDNKKKKWLNNIKVNETTGILSYAGNFGNPIGGLYIDNLTYRVHDKVKNKWLHTIEGRSNYAGNLGNAIDGVQIKGAIYRVHLLSKGWLSWIKKWDETNQGYAGILGKTIDAIQIKIE